MKVIAHRGASHSAPENTLAAFKSALDMGVDMIELDVRSTLDNEIVVYHDANLKRTSSIEKKVIDMTKKDLLELDAGSWFNSSFSNEKIPSLDQTFETIGDKCEILVEIKSDNTRLSTSFLRTLFKTIYQHRLNSSVILQSFDTRILNRIHQLDPSLRLQKLIVLKIPLLGIQLDQRVMLENVLAKGHYEAINVDHRFASPQLIDKIHRFNKKIYCWTVDDPSRMKKLSDIGVDGIITNQPAVLKNTLSNES